MSSLDSSNLMLRAACWEELKEVIAVIETANEEYRPVLGPTLYEAYLDNVRSLGDVWEDIEVYVTEIAGQIRSCVTFFCDASHEGFGLPRGWAGFRTLAICPSARGLGLGRGLVEICLCRARELGVPCVMIHTASFMTTARALYERIGFRRAPEWDVCASNVFGQGHFDQAVGDVQGLAYQYEFGGIYEPHIH